MNAFNLILSRLTEQGRTIQPRGTDRAMAQCPAHDDRTPSLSVARQPDGALVKCFAECETTRVMDALGLTMRDLFDNSLGADYQYRDGRTVHRTYDDSGRKKFRQSGNTGGRELYRVDRLEHTDPSAAVYVVEGEKDVHAVESAGGAAVCNAMGAGKAKMFDWSPLAGRTVVIVADNDEPGRKHAAQVREILEPIAASITMATARSGKDAADHIAAGHGLDEFDVVDEDGTRAGMDGTWQRPRVWRATELERAKPVEWLAKQRIVTGAVNYMLGPEGIGKSLFLVWLTSVVTTGKAFPQFGIPVRTPRRVVLVLTEDDWSTIARPRLEVAGADLDYISVICAERDGSGSPVFPRDIDLVEEAAQDAAVVIVDAWADTLPSALSVKDPQQARQALHPWKELGTRTGAAVLLSGHTNRERGGNVRNSYGMSGELRKKARLTILAQPDPSEDGVLVIGPEKTNLAPQVAASRFKIESVPVFDPTEDSDGTVPKLVWVSDAQQSAREMFADAAAVENGDDLDERKDADEWLRSFLAQGSKKATDVYSSADANGFSKDQIKRSKRRIKATAERPVNPGPWFWALPRSEQGAEPETDVAPVSVLPVLPVLPVRSEGVRAESTDVLPAPHGEDEDTTVRTPGRSAGQWIGSGEPVGIAQ